MTERRPCCCVWAECFSAPSTCIARGRSTGVNLGVFDRRVPEAICRLLDPGEVAFDVGANVGQNTSMMAVVPGRAGRVHSIEPHPATHPVLSRNVARWRLPNLAGIVVHPVALGSSEGTDRIHEPAEFDGNSGSATLVAERGTGVSHEVLVTTLDELAAGEASIDVLKLDVEGYQLEVLRGARGLLAARAIRDVIFEDAVEPQPSAVRRLLEDAGFTVFAIDVSFTGPRLTPAADSRPTLLADYLATRDPARALAPDQDP